MDCVRTLARSGQTNLTSTEEKMSKRVGIIALAVILVLPIGLASAWLWGQVASPAVAQTETGADHSPAETITVVGQGSVRIKPDIAQVSIGVETSAETVGQAVEDNKAQMESIMEALTQVGIAEKDIQTMNYSIQFDQYPESRPLPAGTETEQAQPAYRVTNMVNVTIRDLEEVSNVLDAVVAGGANNIWGVTFSLEDQTAAQADARTKAIEDAGARAKALAELSGVTLGPVMSVSEVISGSAVPVVMREAAMAAGGAGPISPGELEIGYQVQVAYFIER
jgi:uncharacterized protein YggE